MKSVGIDLGGTYIKAALIGREEGIVTSTEVPTEADKGPQHVLDNIAKGVLELKKQAGDEVYGIGIGSPGVISMDRTTVHNPPNFPGWTSINVYEEIFKRTDIPCLVENDANLAALGSSRFGAGRNFEHMIMLTLGTGVGGGIIIDRHLYRGATGGAAELGHVIIDYNGPSSNSPAKGGIEAYIGQRFLSRRASTLIEQNPDNPLYKEFQGNFDSMEPVDLYNASEDGNTLAQQILQDAGRMLGYAIVNYVHILDIRKIVVGGGVSRAGDWILKPAREYALERLMKPFHSDFEIVYEDLGNKAGLLGAGSLAFENLTSAKQTQ